MRIGDVISGIGLLILVYLLVKNSTESARIISSIANASTSTITTLQGR
jgi:hypothetical protein